MGKEKDVLSLPLIIFFFFLLPHRLPRPHSPPTRFPAFTSALLDHITNPGYFPICDSCFPTDFRNITSEMICSVCQTTLQAAISHFRLAKNQDERRFVRATSDDGPDEEHIQDHHKTLNSFKDSIDQGCYICSFLGLVLKTDMAPLEVLWGKIETGEVSNSYGNSATQLLMKYRRPQDYGCFTFSFRDLTRVQLTSDDYPCYEWEDDLRDWQYVLEINEGRTRESLYIFEKR